MNSDRWAHIRDIVERAFELDGDERRSFLSRTCAGDESLLADVARIVDADEDDSRLSAIVADGAAAFVAGTPSGGLEGRRVGGYRLVRLLAAGGMGAVYEAEQDEPRRRVALKTLPLGFGSEEAKRRFRYESEILARLSHDGIAKVHEVGTHREGALEIPWFAMEFVEDAADLVSYATRNGLSRAARLALFLDVCGAVQHGHEKGVVHRDLKPGNLLVNGAGRLKVIDFGVARMADADFGASMLRTRTGEIVGTLKYMSPEQVAGRSDDIDVRTDVFALGLVLHELLTGRECRDLTGLSFTEATRAIQDGRTRRLREVDARQPEELEWIVGKATAVERRERYASARELAADVRRFLTGEPVDAAAPSRLYRFRKFVGRNRVAVAVGSLVLLLLAGGFVGTSIGLVRERRERARKDALNEFLVSMLNSVSPHEAGHEVRVVEILDAAAADVERRFEGEPELKAGVLSMLGQSYIFLGRESAAVPLFRECVEILERTRPPGDRERVQAQFQLGAALSSTLALDEAEKLLRRASAESAAWNDETVGIRMTIYHVKVLRRLDRLDDARRVLDAAIARYCPGGRIGRPMHVYLFDQRAALERMEGRLNDALETEEMVRAYRIETFGSDDPDLLGSTINYAGVLGEVGRREEALELLSDLVSRTEHVLGQDHSTTITAIAARGDLLLQVDRRDEAAADFRTVLSRIEAAQGPAAPLAVTARDKLARICSSLASFAEAEALFRRQIDVLDGVGNPQPSVRVNAAFLLGCVLNELGRTADAEPFLRDAFDRSVRIDDTDERPYAIARELVDVLTKLGRTKDAAEWRVTRDRLAPRGSQLP